MLDDVLLNLLFNEYKKTKENEKTINKISNGCIGALIFYGKAIGAFNKDALVYEKFDKEAYLKAETAFRRMARENIVGEDLFILWNDCCSLNTENAVQVMLDKDIDEIKRHINKGNGRGIPFTEEEMSLREPKSRDGQYWSILFFSGENKGKYVNVKGKFFEAKKKVIEKYGEQEVRVVPFDVMEIALCDPKRYVPAPQLLEEIE